MPPDPQSSSPELQARTETLVAYGLDPRITRTVANSEKATATILDAFSSAGLSQHAPDPSKAMLLYTATKKLTSIVAPPGRNILFQAIGDGRVHDGPHTEAAAAWLVARYKNAAGDIPNTQLKLDGNDIGITVDEFEKAAGVGVVITDVDMENAVNNAIDQSKSQLLEMRYRFNIGTLQRGVMETLRFADGKTVNELIRAAVESLLGPKTDADMCKPPKVKKPKAKKVAAKTNQSEEPSDPFEGIPNNFEARDLASAENTRELLEKHRAATGGKIVCRFPPEPNGYLHIGHAKAMFLDFGYAKKMGGYCVLRFDDTNPTVEKTEYIEAIKEMVAWMGHEPAEITFSSDYFEQLHALAVELIKREKAYVCHQTGDEMSRDRKLGVESPYRNRSIEENIRCFSDMRKGKFAEGEATLRMKIDMQHQNLVMRDPVAYRVLHSPHPHVGDGWCIYPSYDYAHCLVDSLEWITHSLCTLEFEIRRDSYYWLLEALDLYRPFVWESARLNLEYTVMSKRKLKFLVEGGHVRGWDDPRMPTLAGMRRRGYTPSSINRFCSAVGISRANNVIGMHVLEHWVRTEHDMNAIRVMGVLRPLKVTIMNFKDEERLSVANHPKKEDMGKREVLLTKTVFVEETDFRMADEKGYYGLAPGKSAMLRYAYPIKVIEVKQEGNRAVELLVEMNYSKSVKPKGVLHWVGSVHDRIEARLYNELFQHKDPASFNDEWLSDLNRESEIVLEDAIIERGLGNPKPGTTFQFERIGYFTVDVDSSEEAKVFNMTVSLKARDSR